VPPEREERVISEDEEEDGRRARIAGSISDEGIAWS
jgi:hypothetical protein